MKITTILLFSLLVLSQTLEGQSKIIRCNIDHKMESIYKADPTYEERIEMGFEDFNRGNIKPIKRQMTITIPVHVIIVHSPGEAIGQGDNLSFDHIMSQIDVINEDFGRYNSDAGNTPSDFSVDDTGIQFCLATIDENGNATNGVTRYPTTMDFDANEITIKNATRWPRDNYLNIWVANLDGVLGYAYLPTPSNLPNASQDGVAVGTPYFGGPGYASGSPYHLGRTATHEIGHFLGLRHVWRNNGCGTDDGISDTPLQDDENYGCPTHPSTSCGNSGDMFMNYMDYVNDDCMNAFTVEQGAYMNTILSTSRASLAGSAGFACAAPDPLEADIQDYNSPSCYLGFNGYINVSASGGTGNYNFLLSNGTSNTTGIFENLSADFYSVTIDDGDDIITLDIELIDPDQLEVIEEFHYDNICFGGFEGTISLYGLGGTSSGGDYLYQLNNETPQADGLFQNLANGSYQMTVMDDNNCTASIFIDINSPSQLELTFLDTTEILCHGDSLGGFMVQGEGGTPLYTYAIGDTFQMQNNFVNLPMGKYFVKVKDMNDCISQDTIDLIQPDSLVTDIIDVNPIDCQGDASGGFTLSSSGGANSYSYSVNGNLINSNMIDGLVAGQYIVNTIDTNNCQTLDTITFTDPSALTMQVINTSPPVCQESADGYFIVEGNGGTPPYVYSLEGEVNSSGEFNNLLPGDYQVTTTDNNGCTTVILATVQSNVAITNQIDAVSPLCNGSTDGSIAVTAEGGSGPFTYQLNAGQIGENNIFDNLAPGEYTITTYDNIGCTQTTLIELTEPDPITADYNIISDTCGNSETWTMEVLLSGGSAPYTLNYNGEIIIVNDENAQINGMGDDFGVINLIDNNGCEIELPYVVEITEPLTVSVAIFKPASCDGSSLGEVRLTLSGGTGPYTFLKDGVENTTGIFNDLEAGFHQLTGFDSKGCELDIGFSVPTDANGFEISSVEKTNVSCFGENDGKIIATIAGGNGPYSYEINGTATNVTGIFPDLKAGDYILKATDEGNNCTLIANVKIDEPSLLNGDIQIIYGSFEGENKVTISPIGGTPPYAYALDDINNSIDVAEFRNLSTGLHTIYIIDANQCIYEEVVGLTSTENAKIEEGINVFPNPTSGELNVKINVETSKEFDVSIIDITGRVFIHKPKITFTPNNKILTFSLNNLNSSIYIVKIVDGNEIMYRKVLLR